MFISVSSVKVKVLHHDKLIFEIIPAVPGYNNNKRGGRGRGGGKGRGERKRKIIIRNSKSKEIFVGEALHCTIIFQQYKRQRSCKPSKWEGFATTANRTILFVALLRSS